MRRRPPQRPASAPEPNHTGLRERVADLEKRGCALRGAAQKLAQETADYAADLTALHDDLQKVGL